jgi:hypothetical protein|tara:strand:- start:2040 stop:2237 length:198 start_codon:yes stop_codon:yes gene_type:complete
MAQFSKQNFPETLREKIRERMNDHSDAISGGGCKDFSEYKYLTGVIAGLAIVERDLLDLVEIAEQ